MGSRLAKSRRWPALLLTLITALGLVLSAGAPPRAEAQSVPGGALAIKFSEDTLPIAPGVLCQDTQYKILIQPVQVIHHVQKQIHAGIEVDAVLNPITPKYIDLPADYPAAIFYYDAKNTGNETIAYTAYQKTVLKSDQNSQPQIGTGSGNFVVEECPYTVTLVYTLESGFVAVTGLMAEVRLARKQDGTLEGNGPFEFQQMLNAPSPCSADFTGFSAPTSITGTIDKNTHVLELKFQYSPGTTTFTASCPLVGSGSASHSNDPTTLGVTDVRFPQEGGSKSFPALGGQFTVIVNQTVKGG